MSTSLLFLLRLIRFEHAMNCIFTAKTGSLASKSVPWCVGTPTFHNHYPDVFMCCLTSLYLKVRCITIIKRERSGLVVESLTPEREVGGSIPTSAVLCP